MRLLGQNPVEHVQKAVGLLPQHCAQNIYGGCPLFLKEESPGKVECDDPTCKQLVRVTEVEGFGERMRERELLLS